MNTCEQKFNTCVCDQNGQRKGINTVGGGGGGRCYQENNTCVGRRVRGGWG